MDGWRICRTSWTKNVSTDCPVRQDPDGNASQDAGIAVVADGTPEAGEILRRVLWNDPATGVMRHADARYDLASETARKHGLLLPMD